MTGVMDYGIGNIGSILNMIKKVGAEGVPVRTAEELGRCARLILPGVGRFDAGMALLQESGMRGARRKLKNSSSSGVHLLLSRAKRTPPRSKTMFFIGTKILKSRMGRNTKSRATP